MWFKIYVDSHLKRSRLGIFLQTDLKINSIRILGENTLYLYVVWIIYKLSICGLEIDTLLICDSVYFC